MISSTTTPGTPHNRAIVAIIVAVTSILMTIHVTTGSIIPQPKQNVSVPLARSQQQDNLCMAMGNVDNLLSRYLVGIPISGNDYPFIGKKPNPMDTWDEWMRILPHAPQEPEELDLLGSTRASYCINFDYKARPDLQNTTRSQSSTHKDVSPNDKCYNVAKWCNYTSTTPLESTPYSRVLPPGVFLICGDRAWAGIPSNIKGGPCSLGRLTTLTPNITLLHDWRQNTKLTCQKRTSDEFDPNCDSLIYNWGTTKRDEISIFLPRVAVVKVLSEPSHLGCRLSKQANATSAALSGVLLLVNGSGREDFKGLCCFNLSTHSTSNQTQNKEVQDQVKDSQMKMEKKENDWVDKLLGRWEISEWAASILRGLDWVCDIIDRVEKVIKGFRNILQILQVWHAE